MGKFLQATAFTAFATATSFAWSQATPDFYDSAGKAVGQYKGDSVIVPYNNQPVRIYVDAHWDYGAGTPVSSGLIWKYIPVYYGTPDCTGQAYIGTSPTAPTSSSTESPSATSGPAYSAPAYGSTYLVAPTKQGTQWTAYVSAQNPKYAQVPIQSERRYDGSCAAKSYSSLWTTPVEANVPLETYGTPPFYVR